jgi:hypothetical protein
LSPEFACVIVSGEMLLALEAFLAAVWHFISNSWFYRVLFSEASACSTSALRAPQ